MLRRERLALYGLLGLSLLLHAVALSGGTASAAFASVRSWIQDLGPAERLTLVATPAAEGAEDGTPADDVVLMNRGGRLAWDDDRTHSLWSMATVDDRDVISKLMTSETINDRRPALREELQAESAEYEQQMQAIVAESEGLDPENNERDAELIQDAFQRYQQVQQAYQQWQQSARARGDRLEAEMLQDAYRELVAAVEVVADRRGVDMVIRAVPTGAEFTEQDPRSVSLSMRMRTALLAPAGIDMTEDVLEELGL
jgi:Skp family chaperone for outer membrane proteins